MDDVIGFITDLTPENRGSPKKYRYFNVITLDQEKIAGSIDSSFNIEDTLSGKILLEAAKTNSPVRLRGRLTEGNTRTIKISIYNKYHKCIFRNKSDTSNQNYIITATPIVDAIVSTLPKRLEALVMGQFDEIQFFENDSRRKYKVYIITDGSGASPIVVFDDLIDIIEMYEAFIFTHITSKKLHNNRILSTNSNSTIRKTNNAIEPNLNDIKQTMSIKLVDIEQLTINFEEIIVVKVKPSCSMCKQDLVQVIGKEDLMKCNECSRYSLVAKDGDYKTSVIFQINNQKQTFCTTKNLLHDFYKNVHHSQSTSSDDVCEFFLKNGPWILMISHIRGQIIEIRKEE